MTPISALAILFCIYAVSELIAQKTKAIFSTVLSIAILLLAGFWSGILPRTLIDDAQISGFGNIIAGLLIVSLGTTIDFAELRRQWKVVVTALCGVCGAVAAIVLIGRPFIGSEMAIAGAPIFAGGSAATLIMTSTLKEMNLTTAATFCIVLYVTQKFIGVPIASLLLRRTAKLIRDDAVLVEQYSTLQEENAAAHHGPLHLPKCCERPSMYLAKLAAACTVYPNLNDAELQDSYGVKCAEELISAMLTPGEYTNYTEKLFDICGFGDKLDLVEQAKN